VRKILLQLDTDAHPSVFDRVVAVDAGVDEIFSYGGVTPENVTPLVHGAIFTRGPKQLHNTAIFVGGSDVAAGERVLNQIGKAFFGPLRVSAMMDSNGCNTTAAAAVAAVARHVALSECTALVLGGTGPVGQRAAQILAGEGAAVRIASRSTDRAAATCRTIQERLPEAQLTPCSTDDLTNALGDVNVLIAAGAAGVRFLGQDEWSSVESLKVAVDLNAVPPAGLEGIEAGASGTDVDGIACYGAIGVGGTKMKIHRVALQSLFESNDRCLDVAEIYDIARRD